MTLWVYRAPVELNWKSPRTLARSTLRGFFLDAFTPNRNAMGHASIEFNCTLPDGKPWKFHGATTMADLKEGRQLLLKKKIGLGLLFHGFHGRVETTEEIDSRIERLSHRKDRVRKLTYRIRPEQCALAREYETQFAARGGYAHYGLANRPRYGEGGGCTAYAVSFLDVLGVLTSEERAWTREVLVPAKTIGTEEEPVSIFELLNPYKKSRWAKPGEAGARSVLFYDPAKIWESAKGSPILDRSHFPIPPGPIFHDSPRK